MAKLAQVNAITAHRWGHVPLLARDILAALQILNWAVFSIEITTAITIWHSCTLVKSRLAWYDNNSSQL